MPDQTVKWHRERDALDLARAEEEQQHASFMAWLTARREMLTELIEGRAVEAQMPCDLARENHG